MGGSYYLEALTTQIYTRIKELMEEVEQVGGAVAAIEKGFVQKEIERRSYDIQKQIESGEFVVVGVNKYAIEEQESEVLVESNPQAEQDQIQRLQALKNRRSQDKVDNALAALKQTAQGDGALMPVIIQAVESYASLGEICGLLREVFGEYQPVRTI